MIQILGLREYHDPKLGKDLKREAFFANGWRAHTIDQIFSSPLEILASVPEKERFNLYFTVADCAETRGRSLHEQWAIPFDIDGLQGEDIIREAERASACAIEAIGLEREKTAIVFSGNGVQFFIKISRPIVDVDFFDQVRPHYKAICDKMQVALKEAGIEGDVDPSVWSSGRLMRMPETMNRKPGKPHRMAKVLQSHLEAQDFDLIRSSGLDIIEKPDQIKPEVIRDYPKPDTKAVMEGCKFIQWGFASPAEVKEFQWYAQVSITARLEKGEELTHQMSEGHPGYSFYETELKITQAQTRAGPRTCRNIDTLWDGCKACPHFGTALVSPILITGPEYIKSKDFGFREMRTDKDGNVKLGPPAYGDLIKQFQKEHVFISAVDTRIIYIFKDGYWQALQNLEVQAWMQKIVDPEPSSHEMREFLARILVHNTKRNEWFHRSTEGKMNFKNGIFDLSAMTLTPHNPEVGFTNILPYNYDRTAKSPIWDKFILDICRKDPEIVALLEEFGGYAIQGGDCFAHKALVMTGDGKNGKSVYVETLSKVVGGGNYSAIMLQDLKGEQARALLVNKLFNYSDETSVNSIRDASVFKTLVSGGEIQVKVVYTPPYMYKNKAKLIILTNDLPESQDKSYGLYRRLIIVDFPRKFEGDEDNKLLKIHLEAELPGICNRLINGYLKLKERHYDFMVPQILKDDLTQYTYDSSTVLQYVNEHMEYVQGEYTPMIEIYTDYMHFCEISGERPVPKVKFFKELRKTDRFKDCKSFTQRVNERVVKSLVNVKLNPANETF